ncbi:hypothetical protein TKK_0015926 [Trichogramma kaykai]|uniref:Lipase n=2 Tax=Trichogramma kaykai TaxID=54128 RepID=A0ABD2WA76_9HYME
MKHRLEREFIFLILFVTTSYHIGSAHIDTPEDIIKRENYPVETHAVETEDGYILSVPRLPNPSGFPVFLQHGLLCSAGDWVVNGKNRSLAFLLWDAGYDVWLGNVRGNTYSKKHKTLSVDEAAFWDFSWHDIGYHDVPSVVEYIVNTTGKDELFYVGISMGGAYFSVMSTERPEVARHLKAAVLLVPAVYDRHVRYNFLRTMSKNWRQVQILFETFNIHEVFGRNSLTNQVSDKFCRVAYVGQWLCRKFILYILRDDPKQIDNNKIPEFLNSFPAGTSAKMLIHWFQMIDNKDFQHFDYGKEKNLIMYNSTEPPKYNLSKIQPPVAVFHSKHDDVVQPKDVLRFYNQVPNKLGEYDVGHSFTHFDFQIGINATEFVYKKILDIFEKLNQDLAENS